MFFVRRLETNGMNANSPSRNEQWRPLALIIVGVAALLVLVIRFIPYEYRMPNFVPAGALFLFAGARLKPGPVWLLPFGLLAGIDLYFLGVRHWDPSPFTFISYGIYLLLGWRLLSRSESPVRIGLIPIAGSVIFFLLTNFGVWLQHAVKPEMYVGAPFQFPPTFAGLIECYTVALPFARGTIVADLIFTVAFIAAHAVLARTYFPAERVLPASTVEVVE
jgi:hypothetical protein